MTNILKNKILNYLYNLKSMGFEYHKNLDLFNNELKNFKLPNTMNELEKVSKHCYLCDFSKSRKNVLFGYGNINSKIMFITDEPSDSENEIGEFYTGKSGELLKNMIENVLKVKKEDVYITSLVKCKSSAGLTKLHVDNCNDYFQKQLELIKPKIIVVFGEKAYSYLLSNNDFLTVRGKELRYNDILLIATFDATYLLRNPSLKKDAYYDMMKIKNLMEKIN